MSWNRAGSAGASPTRASNRHACALLGVPPERCVYLDDLGINLKPARAMGMRTIKVDDPDAAIDELQEMVGIPLRA